MCNCLINSYYIFLFYIFGIPTKIDENTDNENQDISYQEFLPNTHDIFTTIDLNDNINNPMLMRR